MIRRRWFLRLSLLALVLATAVGVVLLTVIDGSELEFLAADLRRAMAVFVLIRLTIIVGLFLAWPSLLRSCLRRNWITADVATRLVTKRTRLFVWAIALELLVSLQILNRLHALFAS